MNKISSYEDSVSGAVDVAREVQRRDLVTEETGKTITHETEELEDRLERLKAEAEEKKKRSIEMHILRSLITRILLPVWCQTGKVLILHCQWTYILRYIGDAFNFCVRKKKQAFSQLQNAVRFASGTFKFSSTKRSQYANKSIWRFLKIYERHE